MAITTLTAHVQAERVVVTWNVAGGCGPFSGTVSAAVQGQPTYQTYPITAASGTVTDTPPRCAGVVIYRLTLADGSGAYVSGSASALIDRDC